MDGNYCAFCCFYGENGGEVNGVRMRRISKSRPDADPADDDRPGDNGHADSKLAGNRLVSGSLQVAARGQPASVSHLHGLSQILGVKIDEILAVEEEEDNE